MESAVRAAAGIVDTPDDSVPAARTTTVTNLSHSLSTSSRSRIPQGSQSPSHYQTQFLPNITNPNGQAENRIPLPRKSFSSAGRKTPAGSVRSRANSARGVTGSARRDASQTYVRQQGYDGQGYNDEDADVEAGQEEMDGEMQDLPWDSLHPCWPHLNPHVPRSSGLYASTRIIRIQRDYRVSGDLYPQFDTLYPEILEGCLSQTTFNDLITSLNTQLKEVFNPFGATHFVDAVLSILTGWLWEDAGLTKVKRGVKSVETYCQKWNRDVAKPNGVEMIPLRRTAFLTLDLQVPDPSAWLAREGGLTADLNEEDGQYAVFVETDENGNALHDMQRDGLATLGSAGNSTHGTLTQSRYLDTLVSPPAQTGQYSTQLAPQIAPEQSQARQPHSRESTLGQSSQFRPHTGNTVSTAKSPFPAYVYSDDGNTSVAPEASAISSQSARR